MVFDKEQTEFTGALQREVWQTGTHIVPLEVSLADIESEQTREGCRQIYGCIMEILADMYDNTGEYKERPRWYTCDYLACLSCGGKPMKKHEAEYNRYLTKINKFGFEYDEHTKSWTNKRYPLFFEYYPRFDRLFKERKRYLGGYTDRLDFRLFAKHISLSFDDITRPLSSKDKTTAKTLHDYALSVGMKMEIKSPYTSRYLYKKLYSLVINNSPFSVELPYCLNNGKYIDGQLELFLNSINAVNCINTVNGDNTVNTNAGHDADAIFDYIKDGLCVCNACGGKKKAGERCGRWVDINGARRMASMCHPAIGKRRGVKSAEYSGEDIQMLKRLLDIRILQVDSYMRDKHKDSTP